MPFKIDHFRVRDLLVKPIWDKPEVAGQFQGKFTKENPPQRRDFLPLWIEGPKRLLVPTDKEVEEHGEWKPKATRQHADDHLLWYDAASRGQRGEPDRKVTITNQIEQATIVIGNVAALLTPAFKGELDPGHAPIPTDIDHYLLYHVLQASGRNKPKVRLKDQFDRRDFQVRVARYFGIPVIKLRDDAYTPEDKKYVNPEDHLTLYLIDPLPNQGSEQGGTKNLKDQFVELEDVEIINTIFLTVPTTKDHWCKVPYDDEGGGEPDYESG